MKTSLTILFSICVVFRSFGQLEGTQSAAINGGGRLNPGLMPSQPALKHFQDNKFGMFIHWGPVALRGTEIGWSRGKQVPMEEYDVLYKEFNPVLFDAEAWVRVAKEAGMRYLVITAKHHDGFRLWDTEFSTYDIMSSPYKKDILKELAQACKKLRVDFGVYYSILDWHSPDYEIRGEKDDRPVDAEKMHRHIDLVKNELREIVENYDPFLLWFDGQWEKAFTTEMGAELYAFLRALKSDLVINDRVDKSHNGPKKDAQGNTIYYAGDYRTPEQWVGSYDIETAWETCMTICQQWAWKPNDKMKPLDVSLKSLSVAAGGGGNLLYNVGPMPDGRIEARQAQMLKKMGNWLEKNGEAFYGTIGGPYLPTSDYVSTRKGNSIFIHIHNQELGTLMLPLPKHIKVKSVTGENMARYSTAKGMLSVYLNKPASVPAIIKIDLDKDAVSLESIQATH